jgi:tetratricopeptide (TPR) repeat protein
MSSNSSGHLVGRTLILFPLASFVSAAAGLIGLASLGCSSLAADTPLGQSPGGSATSRIESIRLLVDLGQYRLALNQIRQLSPSESRDEQLLVLAARSEAGIGDIVSAEDKYLSALKLNPKSSNAYLGLGMIYGRKGDMKKALSMYDRAIDADPQSARAFSDRGVVKGALNRLKDAMADFKRAIQIDPRYADAYRNRGIIREATKDIRGACSDWLAAKSLGQEGPAQWYDSQCKQMEVDDK